MDKFYVKDLTFHCNKCGAEISAKEMINDGEADIYDYADISYPDGFNPFDEGKDDRISILYTCYCPKCEQRLDVEIVCKAFALEVRECEECETIVSEDLEELNDD